MFSNLYLTLKEMAWTERVLILIAAIGIIYIIIDNSVTYALLTLLWDSYFPKKPDGTSSFPLIASAFKEILLISLLAAIASFLAFERFSLKRMFEGWTKMGAINPNHIEKLKKFHANLNQLDKFEINPGIAAILKDFINTQEEIAKNLSNAIINIPLELVEPVQNTLMNEFDERMDAVSYDDLRMWNRIYDLPVIKDDDFDADLGRRYYRTILSQIDNNNTVVTRIFVLKRSEVQDDLEMIARIIERHEADSIGVALMFIENLNQTTRSRFRYEVGIEEDQPRNDFALLNVDTVATFFSHLSQKRRFEAIFNITKIGRDRISLQREVHKTFLAGAVFGTERFYKAMFQQEIRPIDATSVKNIRPFYNEKEKAEFENVINFLRERKGIRKMDLSAPYKINKANDLFSVVLSSDEINKALSSGNTGNKDLSKVVIEKLNLAIDVSIKFKSVVRKFDDMLKKRY